MPSLIPGFEYDIFISYRQNDNRSGWVTEFVKNLEEELAATIKDPVSVYFDSNRHDGLLENHDVDDSLKSKLKSVILISIISQTYCDTRSFAWKNEFVAFKKMSSEDPLGLKIKLANGNVASRILPVCIHELEPSDKQLVETELGGVLRGIEFIYRSTGVVRPLKAFEEESKGNLNHTFYRDQVNKVARAIKEIINALQHPTSTTADLHPVNQNPDVAPGSRKKLALLAIIIGVLGLLSFTYYYLGGFGTQLTKTSDKSIAVLPFENMNHDPEQDYFSNGIAEDILNHLTKVSDLRVKSRTSTLQYKGTQKSITQIGNELGVGNIVEGSVRRVGDKVRIVVQLIDAESDIHLWSETYDRELKDVLFIQSEIAVKIADALKAKLTTVEKENIQKEVSNSVTAYDYFLKARELSNKTNFHKEDVDNSLTLINQALALDPNFSKAYALKGSIWREKGRFGVSQKIWQDSAMYFSAKSISLDPRSPDGYILQGRVNRYLGNLDKANLDFQQAFSVAPNDPEVLYAYGVQSFNAGDERGADYLLKAIGSEYSYTDPEYYIEMTDAYYFAGDVGTQESLLKKAKSLAPGERSPFVSLAVLYWHTGRYELAIREMEQAEKISPDFQGNIDLMGWLHFSNNDLEKAAAYWSRYKAIEAAFEDSSQTVPFRHRLGMVYMKMGRKKDADALFKEDLKIRSDLLSNKRSMGAWGNRGGVYYDMALDQAYFGNQAIAVQYLDSAFEYFFRDQWFYRNDPLLASLRNRDDFKVIMKKVDSRESFLKSAFSNAINRMEAGQELKNVLK